MKVKKPQLTRRRELPTQRQT